MTDERIIAYLLGELPEEESEQFEDECFACEDWPPEVELAEKDLIDAYLRHELTEERRQRFERNYLTTEARQESVKIGIERVRIDIALLRHIDEYNSPSGAVVAVKPAAPRRAARFSGFWSNQTTALRYAAMLASIAVIAGAFWLYFSRSPETFTTLNLAITVSNNRAEGTQAVKVMLPLKDDALKIILKLPERTKAAQISRVILEKADGETKTLEIAQQDAQFVAVVIPAEQLERGQYVLKLFELTDDGAEQRISGSYFFTVE